jgi:hypothetical protein
MFPSGPCAARRWRLAKRPGWRASSAHRLVTIDERTGPVPKVLLASTADYECPGQPSSAAQQPTGWSLTRVRRLDKGYRMVGVESAYSYTAEGALGAAAGLAPGPRRGSVSAWDLVRAP